MHPVTIADLAPPYRLTLYPSMSIPSPRPLEPSKSPPSQHVRRPSLPISPTLSPRAAPVPVPQRHGSLVSRKRPSFDAGSYGSLSSSLPASVVLAPRDATWLDTPVGQILHGIEANCPVVDHMTGTEEAVEVGPLRFKADARCSSKAQNRAYWCKKATRMASLTFVPSVKLSRSSASILT